MAKLKKVTQLNESVLSRGKRSYFSNSYFIKYKSLAFLDMKHYAGTKIDLSILYVCIYIYTM